MLLKLIHISVITGICTGCAGFLSSIDDNVVSKLFTFVYISTESGKFGSVVNLLPAVIIGLPVMNLFVEDMDIYAVYLFTRGTSRSKWYFGNIITLAAYTLVAVSCFLSMNLIMLFLFDLKVFVSADLFYSLKVLFLLYFSFAFFMYLCVNTFEIRVFSKFSLPAFIGAVVLWSFLPQYGNSISNYFFYYLNPMNNFRVFNHNFSAKLSFIGESPYQYFTFWFSLIYFAMADIALIVIGSRTVNNLDLSLRK